MRNCTYCGAPLDDDALFCSNCGKKIEPQGKQCPRCGTIAEANSSYCAMCGTSLDAQKGYNVDPMLEQEETVSYDLEEEKDRTWWYVIGVVVFALLAFGSYYVYKNYNNSKRQKEAEKVAEAYCNKIDEFEFCYYFLYDITQDEIPELWIIIGTCEAEKRLYVFTYKKGIECIFQDSAFHTGYYQGKDYVLALWTHMDYAGCGKITYNSKNGELKRDELFNEISIDRLVKPKEPEIEMYNYDNKQPIYNWLNFYTNNEKNTTLSSEEESYFIDLVKRWDETHNRNEFDECGENNPYAETVNFYGMEMSGLDAHLKKVEFLAAKPDFRQESKNVKVTKISDKVVICDFEKHTFSDGKAKVYPSYLYWVDEGGGFWKIAEESDSITDHTLNRHRSNPYEIQIQEI